MDHKKIRKSLIFIAVCIGVMMISMFISDKIINRGNTDLTVEMPPASLPVAYLAVNDEYINELHGYVSEMEGNYLRGSLTPLSANRTIPVKIETFDAVVTSLGYEIRSIDCTRLIENQESDDFSYNDNIITLTIPIKDLIEENREYMLVLKCILSDGRTVRFYARFIDRPELYLGEKMEFVRDFSDKTFDKEAAEEIRKYMESNSEGDNSSFGYVNIHSNFNQLTWGSLEPALIGEKRMTIWDIDTQGASISLNYCVLAKGETYDISEFFRLHRGSDRIYLMEYERTMNQVFDDDNSPLVNGKILHGIISKPVIELENEEASVLAFVQQDRLYSYNRLTNTLSRVFSFWDKDNNDRRTRYLHNNIKPLSIDDQGNIYFIVYGYMNRGLHEGEEGVAIYRYNSEINANEEIAFVASEKSYEILMHDVESLSFLNSKNIFYIVLDGTIYSVNLETNQHSIIATGVDEQRFVSSEDNSMIAWQEETELLNYHTLKFMSLESSVPMDITTGSGNILLPLGFINKDFVYGVIQKSDITLDETGSQVLPMYQIRIQDLKGNILKTYEQAGYYIVSAEFEDNTIKLTRLERDLETNQLIPASDDQIMNNETSLASKNRFTYVVTDEMETTYQTMLYKEPDTDNFKITTPNEVLYEGDKQLFLNQKDSVNRYFVYSKGMVDRICTEASVAVHAAEELSGVVVDKSMNYIWEFGNRNLKITLPNIEPVLIEDGESSASVCLDTMLKYSGTYVETEKLLNSGKSALSIMSENLKGDSLDLTGCSLSSVLYYVSCGYPVMAFTGGNNAVLIVGFDSKNTILFNPLDGTVAKMGINDSTNYFNSLGNRFLTYIPYEQ